MDRPADWRRGAWHWGVLGLVLLFVVAVRIRLLNVPLERDEGEFAYAGQLMLDGVMPYKFAYVIKLPGTAAMYALAMAIFGQTAAGIHLGLLFANVTAVVLLFLLAARWFGKDAGLISAAVYALMSLSSGTLGSAAHATQFVMPAALGGILLLLRAMETGRLAALFGSGILFGCAFVLKQPGILFGVYGGLLLLANEAKNQPFQWVPFFKKAGILCLGILLPFAIICLACLEQGVFERFWYWSFTVAGGGWVSAREGWGFFLWYAEWVWKIGQWPFWILAGLSAPFILRSPQRLPFLAFCGASVVCVGAGLLFQRHYFVMALPAAGMLIGLSVTETSRLLKNSKAPFLFFCLVCGYAVLADGAYYFSSMPDEISDSIYRGNPFRAAVAVGDYIRKNSPPGSRVAVLGSEPEIYFYSRRLSATGHVSTYILMEGRPYSHAMQEEMIREIQANRPEYVVYINMSTSWLEGVGSGDRAIMMAMAQYVREHCTVVGLMLDDPSTHQPVLYWDAAAQAHRSDPQPYISVYKARPEK